VYVSRIRFTHQKVEWIFFGCNANKVIDKYVRRVDKWKRIHASSELDKKNLRFNDDMEYKERIKKRARNKYRHVRKKWVKSRCRLQNAIKHFQYNVAHQLCRNYETLLIPTYSTMRLVLKEGRKLPLKVIKIMQALSFYQFTNRLKRVASLYPGTVVQRVSEAHTTMTCGNCGLQNKKVIGGEIFKCNKCGLPCDRDVHASRNVGLRSIENFHV
jgi:putative transposase